MRNFLKANWMYVLGGLLVLVLFSLRFYNLTIIPVFADEAIYIRWAQVMRAEETLRFLPLSDGKQPLYMWLVIPFLKIVHDPLFAGRMVSVFSGFGTLAGITLLSWLLFKSKTVTLAAALIYSLSSFSFFFDRMALVDSTLSMFGVWTFIFSYLAIVKKRLDFAMLAGFSLGGAWLTKSPALFFALMLPSLWLFADWSKKLVKNITVFGISLSLSLVTVVIGYGMYNILRLGPNFSVIARRNLDYIWPLSHLFTSPLDPLFPFLDRSLEWIRMMGPWPILILAVFGIVLSIRKNWRQIMVLIFWLMLPIVVQSEFAKVFTARYIYFSIPYLILISAAAFITVSRTWLKVLTFAIAFFAAQSLLFNYKILTRPESANLPRSERSGYLEEWTSGYGIRETADYLRNLNSILGPDGKIVVGTEGYFGTLPDGLQMYLYDAPSITVIGTGLEFDHLSASLSESKKSGNRTFWVVNKRRFGREPEEFGLRLIREFPKAISPDKTQDSLLLMEVI